MPAGDLGRRLSRRGSSARRSSSTAATRAQGRARRFLLAAGVAEREIDRVLSSARAIAADHGSALLQIRLGAGGPSLTLTHDNVAPLRARALARTQEVAL